LAHDYDSEEATVLAKVRTRIPEGVQSQKGERTPRRAAKGEARTPVDRFKTRPNMVESKRKRRRQHAATLPAYCHGRGDPRR